MKVLLGQVKQRSLKEWVRATEGKGRTLEDKVVRE